MEPIKVDERNSSVGLDRLTEHIDNNILGSGLPHHAPDETNDALHNGTNSKPPRAIRRLPPATSRSFHTAQTSKEENTLRRQGQQHELYNRWFERGTYKI